MANAPTTTIPCKRCGAPQVLELDAGYSSCYECKKCGWLDGLDVDAVTQLLAEMKTPKA